MFTLFPIVPIVHRSIFSNASSTCILSMPSVIGSCISSQVRSAERILPMKRLKKRKGFSHDKPCTDHLGNRYPNIQTMCRKYGINPETYTRRITVYHMSIEEALTTPVKPNGGQSCRDHNGRLFKSRSAMCRYWNIDRKLFEYRISHGWSLEDALTKPRRRLQKPARVSP